ncbi:MAG: WD40/YVTN/BNR-like repeat-containing protein [Candidatus Rokuibacteriota bacterium]
MRLWIGTENGLHEVGDGEGVHFAGRAVTALTREGARWWWTLLDGREVLRGGPGGWKPVASLEGPAGTSVLAAGGAVWVGTEGAHLVRVEGSRLAPVEAFDRAPGRDRWYTPWGDPADVRSLAAGADGVVYVNVHVGGVVRSADAGRAWQPTVDIEADVHQVLAHPTRAGVVLAAAAVGLLVSGDGGETWRTETAGLHATYARAVAVAGESVLLSVSSGPGGRRAGLYRRPLDADGPFERCREGLPEWFGSNVDTGCLAAAGPTAALGTDAGDVFVSTDAGVSWSRLAKGLPPITCVAPA